MIRKRLRVHFIFFPNFRKWLNKYLQTFQPTQ